MSDYEDCPAHGGQPIVLGCCEDCGPESECVIINDDGDVIRHCCYYEARRVLGLPF